MNYWRLKKKIHISWLIAIVCGAVFIGIFIAQYFKVISPYFLFISLFFITIGLWRKNTYMILFLIIGGMFFGLWRGSAKQIEIKQFVPMYGSAITVGGSVSEDVDFSSSNQIVVRLNNLLIKNKKMPGTLWVTAVSNENIKRGDKMLINGKLMAGFGSFVGVIYRAEIKQISHPQPGDMAVNIRDGFAENIKKAIPEPEASLGIGYLVGQRRALPADLITAFQVAGVTHIVVASGYNLTILVRMARRLFSKISKYLSTLVAGIMIFCFIAVTGVSPSMSRAGLVAGLSLMAWYYGRKFHPIVLLLITMSITVVINPSYAWGDLGWQLSFLAFAGVMMFAPLLQCYMFGDKKPGLVGQVLGETISAQLITAPVIILAFGQFSNVAIIANLLVLPFVPLAMLLTFLSGIGGLLLPGVAYIVGLPATWLMSYMIKVIDFLANLPWATSSVKMPWWVVCLYYAFVALFCVYMQRVTKYKLREVNLIE